MKNRLVVLLLALAVVSMACQPETTGPDDGSGSGGVETPGGPGEGDTPTTTVPLVDLEAVRQATVKVQTYQVSPTGEYVESWWGTGSIVHPSGLILTNAHVAAPEAPGLEILYARSEGSDLESTNPALLEIGVFVSEDQLPDYQYVAEVMTVDGWLDLAVLRIVSDIDGNAVSGLDLPGLALGDSDLLQGSDPITVLGYPLVGGDTLSTAAGIVSGFNPDDKIVGLNRGWIKTDALIRGGNSGGLAVDENYQLIGVPTRGGDAYGELRPVNLAKELIDDALAGEKYARGSGIVQGSGQESMSLIGWSAEEDPVGCLIDPARSLPSGPSRLWAAFGWSGFVDGADMAWQWVYAGDDWYQGVWDLSSGWDGGPSGTCLAVAAGNPDGSALPDGTYGVIVYAGETLRQLANESVTVGVEPTPEGITLQARLVDGDTNQQIGGGYVAFLAPGTDPVAWYNAETLDMSVVVGFTQTAADAYVSLNNPVEPGVAYPWLAEPPVDSGYAPFYSQCCYTIPDDITDDTVQVDFIIRKPTS